MARLKLLLVLLFVIAVGVGSFLTLHHAQQSSADKTARTSNSFNKHRNSNDKADSLWVIVNKRRPLNPKEYVPKLVAPNMQLRLAASDPEMQISTAMRTDLEKLSQAATHAGLPLMLASGYRSYYTQITVYGDEIKAYGQAIADRESARPGYSEHQTGLAVDLEPASRACEIQRCFGDLPEGKWLAAHAHEYGFVLRYLQGKESATGYRYEPWHIRYVGRDLASEVNRLGNPTLESFFGLPTTPDYTP